MPYRHRTYALLCFQRLKTTIFYVLRMNLVIILLTNNTNKYTVINYINIYTVKTKRDKSMQINNQLQEKFDQGIKIHLHA